VLERDERSEAVMDIARLRLKLRGQTLWPRRRPRGLHHADRVTAASLLPDVFILRICTLLLSCSCSCLCVLRPVCSQSALLVTLLSVCSARLLCFVCSARLICSLYGLIVLEMILSVYSAQRNKSALTWRLRLARKQVGLAARWPQRL
jgi:hypothetical protein